jgi:hypothetical protein
MITAESITRVVEFDREKRNYFTCRKIHKIFIYLLLEKLERVAEGSVLQARTEALLKLL